MIINVHKVPEKKVSCRFMQYLKMVCDEYSFLRFLIHFCRISSRFDKELMILSYDGFPTVLIGSREARGKCLKINFIFGVNLEMAHGQYFLLSISCHYG